jgi:hypothetical protein
MPCANLIAPLGPVLIAVRATSSRSLFNSFNLSVAKHTNKKKKKNPEPQQSKTQKHSFSKRKTPTARISSGHRLQGFCYGHRHRLQEFLVVTDMSA